MEVKERKNGRHAIALDSVENVLVECVETINLGGLAVGTVYRVNTWDKTPALYIDKIELSLVKFHNEKE